MRKDELVQSVRDYVNDDKANYALLIDGAWGCGKSYLYENVLKDEISKLEAGKNKRKYNVYISLYGISTVEQLAKELVTNYLLESKFHGDEDRQKRYAQFKKAAGIISKIVSFSIKGLSINLDNGIKQIKKGNQFEDMVICFDDFERCSIPVVDLFGMINNLVEHCKCKVIILADEDNIGKVYANTNVELKYASLLQNRKVVDNKDAQGDEIGIEDLKQLNEKVYSENYIYKDIKEKVIGLTLMYTPDLKEEFDSIINNVVSDRKLKEKLTEKKDIILEYMSNYENNNIRIMRSWLVRFEKIYKVLMKFFSNEEYFDEVFDRFANYSIWISCAIGKNQTILEWDDDKEIGYLGFEDPPFSVERHRFIDDLYIYSLFDDGRICKASKSIIAEMQRKERERLEKEKKSQKCIILKELEQWYYLEDDKIKSYLEKLINEINNGEYDVQDYQHIIYIIVILVKKELCEKDILEQVSEAMVCKIHNIQEAMNVENYQYHFLDSEEVAKMFHQYYDAVYSLIVEKNKELSKKNMNQVIDYSTGEAFYNSCKNNYDTFFSNRSFVSYIDFEKIYRIISTGTIKDVYDVEKGFKRVYDFNNLNEFYYGDAGQLKVLIEGLERLDYNGKTRGIAVQVLINTLNSKIEKMRN